MTKCGFCNKDKPYSGMAAQLPQGGRAHICIACVKSGKYKVTFGEMRTVKVENKGKVKG